jgi:hypothetical protein
MMRAVVELQAVCHSCAKEAPVLRTRFSGFPYSICGMVRDLAIFYDRLVNGAIFGAELPVTNLTRYLEKETIMNKTGNDKAENKSNSVRNAPAQQPNKGAEKHKKFDEEDDTRNTGFRSSRIRESESRTQDTGDPSVP